MSTKKGFMRNTIIMFTAMFITKLLGALLKIPLGNILGGEGMGYFTTAYSIFTPVLAFAAAGIPTIVTRTVAENVARQKADSALRTRKYALILSVFIGTLGTLAVCAAAVPFAFFIANSPESLPSVLMIAPSVLFCSVTAVYRGYYEGLSDTLPTAVSQVIEAVVRMLFGVGLSYIVFINGNSWFGSEKAALPYSAAAAILGVTLSELSSMLYMIVFCRRAGKKGAEKSIKIPFDEIRAQALCIFRKSLPISIGACAGGVLSFVDMLTVSNCVDISHSLFGFADGSAAAEIYALHGSGTGNFMYGSYAGIVMSVFMLAGAASGLVSRCAFARLTCSVSSCGRKETDDDIALMIKGTAILTAPMSIYTAVLAEPILSLLYASKPLEVRISILPLQILCAGGVISGLCNAVETAFNAFGDFVFPIKASLISGGIKIFLNIVLIIIPDMNIAGAATATVISDIFCLIYEMIVIKRKFSVRIPVEKTLPSVAASLAGAAVLYYSYRAASSALSVFIAIPLSLFISTLLYVLILFAADSREFIRVISSLKKCRT